MEKIKFTLIKRGYGHYRVEVIIDYKFQGEFLTTDMELIDDISEYSDDTNKFYNFNSREELELYVKGLAGIKNKIGGLDFSNDLKNLFNI